MSDSSSTISRVGCVGAWMAKGMRRSRAIVTMQTFRSAEAVRPTLMCLFCRCICVYYTAIVRKKPGGATVPSVKPLIPHF